MRKYELIAILAFIGMIAFLIFHKGPEYARNEKEKQAARDSIKVLQSELIRLDQLNELLEERIFNQMNEIRLLESDTVKIKNKYEKLSSSVFELDADSTIRFISNRLSKAKYH